MKNEKCSNFSYFPTFFTYTLESASDVGYQNSEHTDGCLFSYILSSRSPSPSYFIYPSYFWVVDGEIEHLKEVIYLLKIKGKPI